MKYYKFYKILNEQWIDSIPYHSLTIDIFKNPSQKEIHGESLFNSRGWISPQGDLYIGNHSHDYIHGNLFLFMKKSENITLPKLFSNITGPYDAYDVIENNSPEDVGILVQLGYKGDILPAESYKPADITNGEHTNEFYEVVDRAKQKNKTLNFKFPFKDK